MFPSPAATLRKLVLLCAAVSMTFVLFYVSASLNANFAPEKIPTSSAKTSLHWDDGDWGMEVLGDGGLGVPLGTDNEIGQALPGLGKGNGLLETTTRRLTRQSQSMSTRHASISATHPSSSWSNQPSRTPQAVIQSQIQQLRQGWTPPAQVPNHWPPYQWYANRDYDPNRWEGFEWENDYYINNGVKQFTHVEAIPTPYLTYPDYNSEAWSKDWKGEYVPCEGPRGKLLNESAEDMVHAWPKLPKGFPEVAIGDADAVGIDVEHCFDRHNRYGPYGYGQRSEREVYRWQRPFTQPDWSSIRWGRLQDRCLKSNKYRYLPNARQSIVLAPRKDLLESASLLVPGFNRQSGHKRYHSRTAILIRTWEGYDYTPNDLEAIRALITETSLFSGGEYQVYLLVNIKDANARIWEHKELHDSLLTKHVPPEFQSIAILWNEKVFQQWYPDLGDWQVYWHQFMPLQWFSKMHPEFDFVWNWETDARYTGNHYHFLEQVSAFANKAPRKYLWERNQRFYIPASHGTYEQWMNDTDASIEAAARDGTIEPVWGPQPYNATLQQPIGPKPPRPTQDDQFEWGVDEDADLITLQPIWDPTHTSWSFRDKIFNFIPGVRPHFTQNDPLDENFHHAEFANIPRRTYINTVSRFSRRQLHAMHLENRAGRTMQAEMWPATVALHHGLKAVYAPHPIWTDRRWEPWYMDAIFNADGGEAAKWSGRGDSVYSHDREHNFNGWTWYYRSDFPKTLYRRWLGWSASVGSEMQFPNNPLHVLGGRIFEETGVRRKVRGKVADGSDTAPDGADSVTAKNDVVGGMGRMCLPGMLLHPVKNVYERAQDGADEDGTYESVEEWLAKLFGDGDDE